MDYWFYYPIHFQLDDGEVVRLSRDDFVKDLINVYVPVNYIDSIVNHLVEFERFNIIEVGKDYVVLKCEIPNEHRVMYFEFEIWKNGVVYPKIVINNVKLPIVYEFFHLTKHIYNKLHLMYNGKFITNVFKHLKCVIPTPHPFKPTPTYICEEVETVDIPTLTAIKTLSKP